MRDKSEHGRRLRKYVAPKQTSNIRKVRSTERVPSDGKFGFTYILKYLRQLVLARDTKKSSSDIKGACILA